MSALDAVSGRSEPSAREGGSVCESRVYLGDVSVVQYLAASMLTVTEGACQDILGLAAFCAQSF